MNDPMTIGELASAAGMKVETLRYYERRGLLPEPPRTRTGYRQYPNASIQRLTFIRRAQTLGFTLREIRELLDLRLDESTTCADVEQVIADKLSEIDEKLAGLLSLRAALDRLGERCRASRPHGPCAFLDELDSASWRRP